MMNPFVWKTATNNPRTSNSEYGRFVNYGNSQKSIGGISGFDLNAPQQQFANGSQATMLQPIVIQSQKPNQQWPQMQQSGSWQNIQPSQDFKNIDASNMQNLYWNGESFSTQPSKQQSSQIGNNNNNNTNAGNWANGYSNATSTTAATSVHQLKVQKQQQQSQPQPQAQADLKVYPEPGIVEVQKQNNIPQSMATNSFPSASAAAGDNLKDTPSITNNEMNKPCYQQPITAYGTVKMLNANGTMPQMTNSTQNFKELAGKSSTASISQMAQQQSQQMMNQNRSQHAFQQQQQQQQQYSNKEEMLSQSQRGAAGDSTMPMNMNYMAANNPSARYSQTQLQPNYNNGTMMTSEMKNYGIPQNYQMSSQQAGSGEYPSQNMSGQNIMETSHQQQPSNLGGHPSSSNIPKPIGQIPRPNPNPAMYTPTGNFSQKKQDCGKCPRCKEIKAQEPKIPKKPGVEYKLCGKCPKCKEIKVCDSNIVGPSPVKLFTKPGVEVPTNPMMKIPETKVISRPPFKI